MYSKEEFEDMLDGMVPMEIQKSIESDMHGCDSFLEIHNLCEKGRVFTIKQKISGTHRWCKATCVDTVSNVREECYWCERCNVRASTFDHINCISIISKVRDNLPSYTVHNEYLMYTCEQVMTMKSHPNDIQCMYCGVPEKAKTAKCHMMVE